MVYVLIPPVAVSGCSLVLMHTLWLLLRLCVLSQAALTTLDAVSLHVVMNGTLPEIIAVRLTDRSTAHQLMPSCTHIRGYTAMQTEKGGA